MPAMIKGSLTRERIIAGAMRVASLEGLEGITLGRLSKEIGLSKSGLFAHFESKEQLQLAVLQGAIDAFTRTVITPALAAPRGEPRVRALFEHWLRWDREASGPGGCIFMHLGVELDDQPGPARDALVVSQRQWLEVLARAVRLASAEGHFRPDADPELFAFQLYGIVTSCNHQTRLLQDPAADDRARRAFDALLRSVAAPTRVSTPTP